MEVTNRFKGLDLLDRVPEQLWWEVHNIVQEVVTKIIPKGKKNARRQSGLSEEDLQMAERGREAKGKKKGRDIPTACRVENCKR